MKIRILHHNVTIFLVSLVYRWKTSFFWFGFRVQRTLSEEGSTLREKYLHRRETVPGPLPSLWRTVYKGSERVLQKLLFLSVYSFLLGGHSWSPSQLLTSCIFHFISFLICFFRDSVFMLRHEISRLVKESVFYPAHLKRIRISSSVMIIKSLLLSLLFISTYLRLNDSDYCCTISIENRPLRYK